MNDENPYAVVFGMDAPGRRYLAYDDANGQKCLALVFASKAEARENLEFMLRQVEIDGDEL